METFVKKIYGKYAVQFTQGVQTFTLLTYESTKKHAIWQKEMLDKAFDNFKNEITEQYPSSCIHFSEDQGRNHCLTDKVPGNKCIGVDCGEYNDKK